MFISAIKQKVKLDINKINFPKKFILAYSIQYKKTADFIKTKLKKRVIKSMQVLGCTELKTNHPIVLITDGNFHAINLALQNNEVYKLENNQLKKIDDKLIENYRKKIKTTITKFLHSDRVGIIVSIKPGQENLQLALNLKNKLKNKKKTYFFLTNIININELENFPIEIYVNTACPTMIYDTNKLINYNYVFKVLNFSS